MATVLEPMEARLANIGEREVDYLALYGEAWRRAGLDLSPDLLYDILDREQRCWDRSVRVAEGAAELLQRLRLNGIATAIVSNAPFPPEMMRRQVDENGLGALVNTVLFSSEAGWRKPAPELYRLALQRLGVPAADALYVGDRLVEDYQGPRRAGLRALICTQLARTPPPAGVPHVDRLVDVESWL